MLEVGANRLLSDEYDRAGFLPVVRHKKTGKRELGVPQVGKDILDALMLPGEVYQGNVSMYGEDGRTSPAAIQGAANMGGMLTVGAGALPAQKNTLRMGIKAYHGSPHDFDRFSMDKIGTGEGAQAYGHGLYFAENPSVAKGYQTRLADNPNATKVLLRPGDGTEVDVLRTPNGLYNLRKPMAVETTYDELLSGAKKELETASQVRNATIREDRLRDANELLAWLEKNPGVSFKNNPEVGRMYEVNIDANPDDFLDWDRPLSEQGPKVREAIAGLRQKVPSYIKGLEDTATGSEAMNAAMWTAEIPSSVGASQAIKKAGIPGIKYLDEGSRNQAVQPYYNIVRESDGTVVQQKMARGAAPNVGEGFRAEGPIDPRTRNYVVFDDKLISIVKKYGVAALVSAGVLSQTDAEALAAQGYN
jgi:hypothetical protein